jgi:small GTP-binding protein
MPVHFLRSYSADSMNMNKVVLTGPAGVGKTTLCRCLCGEFSGPCFPTVSAASFEISRPGPDGRPIDVVVWDTAGQEIYLSLLPLYFRGASLILLVYSVADEQSFRALDRWLGQARGTSTAGVVLIGNKSDQEQKVPTADAQRYAGEIGARGHFTVSALTCSGVESLLSFILNGFAHSPAPRALEPGGQPGCDPTDAAAAPAQRKGACCHN